MDFADEAQIEEFNNIRHALHSLKKEPPLAPKGECYFCYEEIEGNKLFCNNICAEKYHKYKQING